MCTIMLSINPEHVENIMQGTKLYEYRKQQCKRQVDKILIYSTSPIMKVVGEADVEEILIGKPHEIWKATEKKSGIKKAFYDSYYEGRMQAVAYKLRNIVKYDEPKELMDYGVKAAPQSFCYVENI